jgi:hypothetical protein
VVNGLTGTTATYKIWSTDASGTAAAAAPSIVQQGTVTLSGGKATITYANCWAHSAYLLQVN